MNIKNSKRILKNDYDDQINTLIQSEIDEQDFNSSDLDDIPST